MWDIWEKSYEQAPVHNSGVLNSYAQAVEEF